MPTCFLLWKPNNRFTGLFSWIHPYRRPFFLINCCHRVLSGLFSVLITSESVLLGVYQEFLARHRPDAWSIALSSVRVSCAVFLPRCWCRTCNIQHEPIPCETDPVYCHRVAFCIVGICTGLRMPGHNHLAHCSCSADHNRLQHATVSPTAADGPWPLRTLSYELCRPCAVSPLSPPSDHPPRFVHLLLSHTHSG